MLAGPARVTVPKLASSYITALSTAVVTPCSWATLTASVGALPGATWVIWRSCPAAPIDSSPAEFCTPVSP